MGMKKPWFLLFGKSSLILLQRFIYRHPVTLLHRDHILMKYTCYPVTIIFHTSRFHNFGSSQPSGLSVNSNIFTFPKRPIRRFIGCQYRRSSS